MGKVEVNEILGTRRGFATFIAVSNVTGYRNCIIWILKCDCGKEFELQHRRFGRPERGNHCGCKWKEHLAESKKKDTLEEQGCKAIYRNYIQFSRVRNHELDIDFEVFSRLIQENCYYCDSKPNNQRKVYYSSGFEIFNFNGLDRVDSKLGYYIGNVVTCCKICNMAKNDMTQTEFFNWIKKVANKWSK